MSDVLDIPILETIIFDQGSDEECVEYTIPRRNTVIDDNYEYKDMVYDFAFVVQDYCREHCLPIFNKSDTTDIIVDTLM